MIADRPEQIQYWGESLYYFASFFTKTSVLMLIARIFRPHRKSVFFANCVISIIGLYYILALFLKSFRCRPIRKAWDIQANGRCIIDQYFLLLADIIISTITDVVILLLPVPLIWRLQTSRKRKWRILIVFAGGIG